MQGLTKKFGNKTILDNVHLSFYPDAKIGLIGVNRSGIFLHLMPIFSTIMAILIFNEKFMFFHLVGAVLIISGIVLSSKGRHV